MVWDILNLTSTSAQDHSFLMEMRNVAQIFRRSIKSTQRRGFAPFDAFSEDFSRPEFGP